MLVPARQSGFRALMDWLSTAGALFLVWLVLVFLFTPGINYHLARRTSVHADDFLYTLQSTCQAALHHGNRVDRLHQRRRSSTRRCSTRSARRRARSTWSATSSSPGRIADQFIEALSERARLGVNVTIVVDAIGSFNLWGRPLRRLREAGCRVESYQRMRMAPARAAEQPHPPRDARSSTAGRVHRRRRHRRLVGVPDGKAARPWRDTMARIEGPVVAALQGVAAENWLECCGEIMTGPEYFPSLEPAGETTAFVVKSSPSDRATASRVAFQLLMEGADHHVRISTPYFLPDRALRRALVALAKRGVAVDVIVPGRHHRPALGAAGEPAHVGEAAATPASASTNTAPA